MLTVPREHRDDGNELRQIDSDLGLWGELQTLDAEANQVRWQDLDRSADRRALMCARLPSAVSVDRWQSTLMRA